jgi:hypothetical protein
LAKVAVQCSADTFVVNQSLVLHINICGENRHLRQARKRCVQALFGKIRPFNYVFVSNICCDFLLVSLITDVTRFVTSLFLSVFMAKWGGREI